jgi:hypothetical protein
MTAQAQRIAELEQRLAAMELQMASQAARIEAVHDQPCVIRSFEDVLGAPLTTASRQQRPRPRHLTVVGGGTR